MHIEELSRQASLDLLAQVRFGRLACAKQSQPYIVPFYMRLRARSSGAALLFLAATKNYLMQQNGKQLASGYTDS